MTVIAILCLYSVLLFSKISLACHSGALFGPQVQAQAQASSYTDYDSGCGGHDCDNTQSSGGYDENSDPYIPEKPSHKPYQAVQPPAHRPDTYIPPPPPPPPPKTLDPYLERAAVQLPYTTYRNQLCSGKQVGYSEGESIGSAVIKCAQLSCEAANAIPRGDGKYDCTFLHGVQGRSSSPGSYCVSGKQLPQINHVKQEMMSRRFKVQQAAAVLAGPNSYQSPASSTYDGYDDILSPSYISTKPAPNNDYDEEESLPIKLKKLVVNSASSYVPPYIPKPSNTYVPPYIPPSSPSNSNGDSFTPPLPRNQPSSPSYLANRSEGSNVRYKPFPQYIPPPKDTFQTVPSPFARK